MTPMDRRLMARLAVALLWSIGCARGASSDRIRIAVIGPDSQSIRGGVLGLEEAIHAARLMGKTVEGEVRVTATPREAERAVRGLVRAGAIGIVGGYDGASCEQLARLAEQNHVLFINAGCRDDALRSPPRATTLHVEASDSIYRDVEHGAPGQVEPLHAVLWHPGLERFGAGQLNQRFQRRFGSPMDSRAWALWFGVKVLWESVLRAGSTRGDSLLSYILSSETGFDGHKGNRLVFGPRNHQLRQPLYLADPSGALPAIATFRSEPAGPSVNTLPELPPGTPLVLVSNEGSADLTVIDGARLVVVATIPLGTRPRGIKASRDGRTAYAALSDDSPSAQGRGDAVAVIDLKSGKLTGRYEVGTDPEAFDLSPDGSALYASNEDAGTLSVSELRTGKLMTALTVGIEPEGVAVSPDGRWVYVTAETSNTVSVVDTRSRKVVASFLTDARPRGVAFSPDGRRAWVTNEISGRLSEILVDRHALVRNIDLGSGARPVGVVISPDGQRAYVATGAAGAIAVVDLARDTLVASIPVGRRPWGVAVSPDGKRVYSANGLSDDLSVIDTESLKVVATIPAGQRPWGVTVTRVGR